MIRTLLAAMVVAALAACGESDPIADRVNELAGAIEDRDSGDVAAAISANYRGTRNESKEQIANEVRRVLFGYQNINVTVSELQTTLSGEQGVADFVATVSGNPKKIGGLDQILPRLTKLKMRIEFREENGEWRATWAEWQEIE